jgi:hypothetical protein
VIILIWPAAHASLQPSAATRIARRRGEEERGDTLFVPERRRTRRRKSAFRAERAQRATQ